jgi:hypothetical protein
MSFPIKRSLLYRASLVKEHAPVPTGFSNLEYPIQDSGIDDKDVQEIQVHIEDLGRKNRITLGSKDFHIKPAKNALVFPLVVNGLMLGIAAGVLILVGQVVTGDRVQSNYEQAFSSVEGQLIQQMRHESDAHLAQKEQEIEDIRKQLVSIKTEERNTANKFEELYRQREREVKGSLEQELASERKRFIAAGVPGENIESLLATYEQERFAYYHAELGKYQAQLEAEQEATRVNYQQLQDKYQQDLRNLNNERRLIQETVRQNENQRRLGIEQGTASQASPEPERTGLAEAQTRLAVLEEQQQQALLNEKRIIGMYGEIRTSLEQELYRDALGQAESLIRYLEANPQESLSPQQRSLDKYLAEALARIARTELTRSQESILQTTELEIQIARLSADNVRLTQVTQELTQTLTDQDHTRMTERTGLETQVMLLEQDNARLTQSNQELSQTLTDQDRTRMTERTGLETRVVFLEQDNARLTQSNQELSQALTNQDRTRMTERTGLEARVVLLEQDNARLTQSNQELSQALADQNSRAGVESSNRLAALEEENRRLNQRIEEQMQALALVTTETRKTADSANVYRAITNAYTRYAATPGDFSEIEDLFSTPEVSDAFPGFLDHLADLNGHIAQDAYQEGIANAASIIETALRIREQDTRTKYLERIRERYRSDTPIIDLIDMLLRRF